MSEQTPEEHEAGEVTQLISDEPPKSGTWIETCEVIENPTDDEVEAGNLDGETVDYEGSDEEPADE